MFKETVDVIKAGVSAYELTVRSVPAIKRLIKRISSQDVSIAVFGCGGTGKTTLGRILHGVSDPLLLAPYQQSGELEKFTLAQNVSVSMVVPPGQERRGSQRSYVLEQLLVGKYKIVMNVVAYGYHSLVDDSYTNSKLYQGGMSTEQFIATHTEDRRHEEVEQLKKIATIVQISKSIPTLMLTLVTKQDLWWKDREVVKDYYENSEYNSVIDEIFKVRGTANFSHEYVSASLVIANFDSSSGERLVSNSEGYDQLLQAENLNEVFRKIDSLCQ
jgi:hypothetical protein